MEVKREYAPDIFRSLAGLKLWELRHAHILDFIDQHHLLTLLDLGTSESTLLMKIQRGLQIHQMVGLDIDDQAITKAIQNLIPQGIQNDYQFHRQYDQTVQLYKGSALEKYSQLKDINFQLVTLVEVIEHIEEKYLPQLNDNVFGYLRPKWVWLSTPNFEFNSVFKWKESAQKFRHDDHKFEWTRKEFQDYVDSVCQKYHYKAKITGVGLAAKDQDLNKGFCTQIAIFERLEKNEEMEGEKLIGDHKVPLELKHEHVNKCWKSNLEHLLDIAMKQAISACTSRGSLDWPLVIEMLRRKTIIKTLRERNSEWQFDYHLKSFVHEYFSRHEEHEIVCSRNGLQKMNVIEESEYNTVEMMMIDEEFEKEMSEWKTFSKEEQQEFEAKSKSRESEMIYYKYESNQLLMRRRSQQSKKSKSNKSSKSISSRSSSSRWSSSESDSETGSKKSKKSQDSWGSVELVEEGKKRDRRKIAANRRGGRKCDKAVPEKVGQSFAEKVAE